MKKILCSLLLLSPLLQASDFRISDDVYYEALHEVQSGQAVAEKVAPAAEVVISADAQEWARCMQIMASPSLEQQMKGKLTLLSLIKKLNLFADDAQLSALIATHEAAIKGEPQASLLLAIALIKGQYDLLVFPRCAEYALPYLEALRD